MTHDDLDTRLAAAERHVAVEAAPPALPARGRRGRRSLPLVAAPILVLAFAAVVVAGTGLQAIFLKGSVDTSLADAGLECMTPPQAAAWLADHGYKQVVWDGVTAPGGVRVVGKADGSGAPAPEGSPIAVPDDGTGITGPTVTGGSGDPFQPDGSPLPAPPAANDVQIVSSSSTAPASGIVLVGSTADGVLHMLVDVTPGATRPAICAAP
jgi:hypothetical protein